jgi:hypothetical protein
MVEHRKRSVVFFGLHVSGLVSVLAILGYAFFVWRDSGFAIRRSVFRGAPAAPANILFLIGFIFITYSAFGLWILSSRVKSFHDKR